jgi:hypothetical protein
MRRRKAEPSPWPRIIAASALLVLMWLSVHTGWAQRAFISLFAPRTADLAERTADQIYDTAQCAQYRHTILQQSGPSAAVGAAATAINQAYEAAKSAGCVKMHQDAGGK